MLWAGHQPWGAASSITPEVSCSACLPPEHAADILVGVGLGCLLQMTSSQLVVKVRLQGHSGTGRGGSRMLVSPYITAHLFGSWSPTASWCGCWPGPWG